MHEHLIFSVPDLCNGLGAAMNGIMLPTSLDYISGISDDFGEFDLVPWELVQPEFYPTFQFPNGSLVLDVLRTAPLRNYPDGENDGSGGGYWYMNTATGHVRNFAPQGTLYLFDGGWGPDEHELFRSAVGSELAGSLSSFEELIPLYQSGELERVVRNFHGIPDNFPEPIIERCSLYDGEITMEFNNGSGLGPFLSPEVNKAWGWMGTTAVRGEEIWAGALGTLGEAVGDPDLFEKNLHWIQQYF